VVRQDDVRRAVQVGDLFEPGDQVRGLDPDHLGTEVDGVVEGWLTAWRPWVRG
jgi:hypothetical protein